MIRESEYQNTAVRELFDKTNRLFELGGSRTVVFKAPTGSGKTVMVAEYLKKLVERRTDNRSIAIIWAAPHQLHVQSKERLEKLFIDSKAIRCSFFDNLIDRQIGDKEILFLNWESINKKENIFIRENETDMNLSKILQNTREVGRTIILIIDESHFASTTETSRELINMFQPQVTIEVSATPIIQGDESVTVHREQVIKEEMIKKYIVINPGFRNIITRQTQKQISFTSKAGESTDEFVLRMAIEKRNSLAESFVKLGIKINPLLLIQLPDQRHGNDNFKDTIIKILDKKNNISVKNGKLAIYLSENKKNLENIKRNDSEVQVMIFKQAIAIGWDCPRASILALFRDWKSIRFSIQTVGRILRMPELKYYENDELNIGYVFTSLEDLSIIEDIAGNYLSIQFANRRKKYNEIKLNSVYPKRMRAKTRLTPFFIRCFLDAADSLELKNKINLKIKKVSVGMLSDGILSDLDKHPDHIASLGKHLARNQTTEEIQKIFDAFAYQSLSPEYFPEPRSVGRVKDAIHYFFRKNFAADFKGPTTRAQIITLHKSNRQYFIDAINKAKEIYGTSFEVSKKELLKVEGWEIPKFRPYTNRYREIRSTKSILQPYFQSLNVSDVEKKFVKFLNNQLADVEWFYKNGESDSTSFAVPYIDFNGDKKAFFVDWIVKFDDGKIGLFDTKEGITAETAKYKAEGLQKYIDTENKKGGKLFGGIVVPKNRSWLYNDSEIYVYDPKLIGWKFLQ